MDSDKNGWRRLIRALVDLCRAWWRVDRIRHAPHDGCLLRLQPDCILRVNHRYYRVQDRSVCDSPEEPHVLYGCVTEGSAAQLRVTPCNRPLHVELRWTENGRDESLSENHVELIRGTE